MIHPVHKRIEELAAEHDAAQAGDRAREEAVEASTSDRPRDPDQETPDMRLLGKRGPLNKDLTRSDAFLDPSRPRTIQVSLDHGIRGTISQALSLAAARLVARSVDPENLDPGAGNHAVDWYPQADDDAHVWIQKRYSTRPFITIRDAQLAPVLDSMGGKISGLIYLRGKVTMQKSYEDLFGFSKPEKGDDSHLPQIPGGWPRVSVERRFLFWTWEESWPEETSCNVGDLEIEMFVPCSSVSGIIS